MMHMAILYAAPDPISPFITCLAVEGRASACLIDKAFIELVDVDVYKALSHWVLRDRGSSPSPTSPLGALLSEAGIPV